MYKSTIFTVLSVCFLSVPAAPAPVDMLFECVGDATWFYVGLGACGYENSDSDPIVALPSDMYSSGSHCNQWVSIKDTTTGHTAYGMVRDECPGCGSESLDLSPSLFEQLAPLSTGVQSITWSFMPSGWAP